MKRVVALAVMCTITAPAAANDDAYEARLGGGVNYGMLIPEKDGIGIWKQDGLDNGIKNGAPVFAVQLIGKTALPWLRYGIGLAHREGPTASGEYISDDCYARREYSGGPWSDSAGMPACDRRYYAKRVSTETNALTLTINPTWQATKYFALSAALGVSLFSTRLDMEWDHTRGVCQTAALCEDQTFRKRGATPYAELTARYSAVFLTGYYAHRENAPESMARGNHGFFTGVAINF